jgi:hypothetical protein
MPVRYINIPDWTSGKLQAELKSSNDLAIVHNGVYCFTNYAWPNGTKFEFKPGEEVTEKFIKSGADYNELEKCCHVADLIERTAYSDEVNTHFHEYAKRVESNRLGDHRIRQFKGQFTRKRKVVLVTALAATVLWYSMRGSKISAVQRLQQRAGYGTWTMTPTGRRDALEASGFRIPASILYQGLDQTLTWLANDMDVNDNTVYEMLVGFENRVRIKKSAIVRMAYNRYLGPPASRQTMMTLSNLEHASRQSILETFPYVLEILLTDPSTGRSRPWADVKDMSRFNRGFLGM